MALEFGGWKGGEALQVRCAIRLSRIKFGNWNYRRQKEVFTGLGRPMSRSLTRRRLNRCLAGALSMLVLTCIIIVGVARHFAA